MTHLYYAQDSHFVLEFMQRDLGITTVNAFRFVSLLPISGIDHALVRGRGMEGCMKTKGKGMLCVRGVRINSVTFEF